MMLLLLQLLLQLLLIDLLLHLGDCPGLDVLLVRCCLLVMLLLL